MEEHIGYSKGKQTDKINSRNGYTKKRLIGSHGEIEISTPRDRDDIFEPMLGACPSQERSYSNWNDSIIEGCLKVY